MAQVVEYKNASTEELENSIYEKQCELGQLAFSEESGHATYKAKLKREIARLKTLLRERYHQED